MSIRNAYMIVAATTLTLCPGPTGPYSGPFGGQTRPPAVRGGTSPSAAAWDGGASSGEGQSTPPHAAPVTSRPPAGAPYGGATASGRPAGGGPSPDRRDSGW